MTEALLILAVLGLTWGGVTSVILTQRVRVLERRLHQEQAETAERLDALENLARDRWLAESSTLGGQVAAMIGALEEAAGRCAAEIAQREAALSQRLAQLDQRLTARRAARPQGRATAGQPAAPQPSSRPAGRADGSRPAPPAQTAEVRRLAADGLTPTEIAHRTGRGVAEIELMLRLSQPPSLQPSA